VVRLDRWICCAAIIGIASALATLAPRGAFASFSLTPPPGIAAAPLPTFYSSGQGLFAARGSFCWDRACVAAAYLPSTVRCLVLRAGARIVFRTHIPITRLGVRLSSSYRPVPAQMIAAQRIWAFNRPLLLRGRAVARVDVTYARGGSGLYAVDICPARQ